MRRRRLGADGSPANPVSMLPLSRAEYFSTIWCFGLGKQRQRGDEGFQSGNRIACRFNASTLNHLTINEILYSFTTPSTLLPGCIACHRFSHKRPPAKRTRTSRSKNTICRRPRIYRLETSPRMISQFGVFTSYQVNVDANGQNIVGDAANERVDLR